MKRRRAKSPIRSAIEPSSALQQEVQDGIGALKKAHRPYLAVDVRDSFVDSLDLDGALQKDHHQDNRWDYLLGHAPSAEVIGLEPRSAKQDEIGTVIKKSRPPGSSSWAT